jgi:hypothetical protein
MKRGGARTRATDSRFGAWQSDRRQPTFDVGTRRLEPGRQLERRAELGVSSTPKPGGSVAISNSNWPEAIFEIVTQLNRGSALMTSQEEREQLAELILTAGKRAKASSACASALAYLTAGAASMATCAPGTRVLTRERVFDQQRHHASVLRPLNLQHFGFGSMAGSRLCVCASRCLR